MKWLSFTLAFLLAISAYMNVSGFSRKSGAEKAVIETMEKISARMQEVEAQVTSLVNSQTRFSKNSAEVYTSVARLCRIFEGILQINSEHPSRKATKPE